MKHYWDFLQEWLDTEPLVYATNGHTLQNGLSSIDKLYEEHGQEVDVIVVFLGTNDYNASLPLGSLYTEQESETERSFGNQRGDEVLLSWDYVGFKLEWLAKFKGDNCNESKLMYTFQTPELATQYYREQIADLEKDDAKLWSVKDKIVTQDNTAEYKGQDKIAVKAAMQQIVLSMGGKLE